MKLCYVCSRYAGDYLERVMNLIEARALARLAAVDEIAAGIERIENNICNGSDATIGAFGIAAYQDAIDELVNHTGVTPSEVQ